MIKCVERKCCDCPIGVYKCKGCTLDFERRTPMDVFNWLLFNGKLKLCKKRVLNELTELEMKEGKNNGTK